MMSEPNIWEKITAYVAETKEKVALEAEIEPEKSSKMLTTISIIL